MEEDAPPSIAGAYPRAFHLLFQYLRRLEADGTYAQEPVELHFLAELENSEYATLLDFPAIAPEHVWRFLPDSDECDFEVDPNDPLHMVAAPAETGLYRFGVEVETDALDAGLSPDYVYDESAPQDFAAAQVMLPAAGADIDTIGSPCANSPSG